MPTSREPARRPTSPKGGGGWLFVLILVGAVAAIYVFAPDLPRKILGTAETPPDGDEPVATQESSASLSGRDVDAASRLGDPSTIDRSLGSAAPKAAKAGDTVAKPAAPVVGNKDEPAAQKALAEAEKSYKAFQWEKAVSAANRITTMDAKPATKVRAKDIIRGAATLQKLFKELDDKDELTRNYDTHPSLVQLNTSGAVSYGVPIRSLEDPTVVDSDPLGWISNQRKTGKLTLLVRGKKDFIVTSLPADKVGEVNPVDMDAVRKEKADEFRTRLDRLKNGDMARNALAWYDAAKFAYRNRLDDHVTGMMDQAILLDPLLVGSVREDKAAVLFASVVLHMKNGNQKQAAAFIGIVNKRFADTPSGKEAKLFYEGKSAELLAMARRRVDEEREQDRQRREARMERAKELGDEQQMAAIAKEPEEEEDTEMLAAAAGATGDEGVADGLFAEGKDFYSQAIDAGNTDNRDVLYTKAAERFTKAMAIYNKLLEKAGDDSPIAMKALECNKLRFGSIKQRRFH